MHRKSVYASAAKGALVTGFFIVSGTVYAHEFVDSNHTQNGGTLTVDPAGALVISDPSNAPMLTFTEAATATGVRAIVVGNLNDEVGHMLIKDASTVTAAGMRTEVATFGEKTVSAGAIYAGLNTNALGTIAVSGSGASLTGEYLLMVGYGGDGIMHIEDSAEVSASYVRVAHDSNSRSAVTVTGPNSIFNVSENFVLGSSGEASLEIEHGAILNANTAMFGYESGGKATAVISGDGSKFTYGNLNIGGYGVAELRIEKGAALNGTVSQIGKWSGSGLVTITDPGTTWISTGNFQVSDHASGTLNILNGAQVSTGPTDIAYHNSDVTAKGIILVSGAGSHWESSGTVHVGRIGKGFLTVEDGASVDAWEMIIGLSSSGIASSGEVRVSGKNSLLDVELGVIVGHFGAGSLTIETGGKITSGEILIANQPRTSATVKITGPDSNLTVKRDTAIGTTGTAMFTIENGASVTSVDSYIAKFNGSNATVIVSGEGSSWTNSGTLAVGFHYRTNFSTAKLYIQNGATVSAENGIIIDNYSLLSGDGGKLIGDTTNHGTIAPGNSVGTLTLQGDVLSVGTLEFELSGLGSYDILNVDGHIFAGGTIRLELLDGFTPSYGATFRLLQFNSFSDVGHVFDFSDAQLPGNLMWNTDLFSIDGSVTVVPEPIPSAVIGAGAALFFSRRNRYANSMRVR